jgi:xanthine dehydrogenase/oxidase
MNTVKFFLNGKAVTLENPSPDLLLIDYLRSEEVGLTGAKKGCGQGGCGACTVILSNWNAEQNKAEHRSINSCLRPVCALDGLSITTIEGTGSVSRPSNEFLHHAPVSSRAAIPLEQLDDSPKEINPLLLQTRKKIDAAREAIISAQDESGVSETSDIAVGMNPVAHRLALNNGTQCGYCTVGWVMNMSAFLAENPKPTKREIENIFDGNICRCTGYRSILTGMKTFASDWTATDETHRMKCKTENVWDAQQVLPEPYIPFPKAAKAKPQPVAVRGNTQLWVTALTLDELVGIINENQGKKIRLVHGNTSYGIYKEEFLDAELLVDIRLISDLYGLDENADEIQVGASTTYSTFLDRLQSVIEKRWNISLLKDLENQHWDKPTWATSAFGAAHLMAHRTAGMIVRNAASIGGNTMLTLKHIHKGEPFPSDLLTALAAIGTRIEVLQVSSGVRSIFKIQALVNEILKSEKFADDIILSRYHIPAGGENDIVLAQKVALREVNAHSIVNAATNLTVNKKLGIEKAVLVFGGIAPFPWRAIKTEEKMRGRLSLKMFGELESVLRSEIKAELEKWAPRMKA